MSRAAERQKAVRIRRKIVSKTATAADKAWLDQYEWGKKRQPKDLPVSRPARVPARSAAAPTPAPAPAADGPVEIDNVLDAAALLPDPIEMPEEIAPSPPLLGPGTPSPAAPDGGSSTGGSAGPSPNPTGGFTEPGAPGCGDPECPYCGAEGRVCSKSGKTYYGRMSEADAKNGATLVLNLTAMGIGMLVKGHPVSEADEKEIAVFAPNFARFVQKHGGVINKYMTEVNGAGSLVNFVMKRMNETPPPGWENGRPPPPPDGPPSDGMGNAPPDTPAPPS